MIKIKIIAMVLFVIFAISINGEEKTKKIIVNGSSSIILDAEYAEISVRIHIYGAEVDANTKKIQKIISDIEKNLNVYEIKEGSFAKPFIEHGFDKSSSKISSSKISSFGSHSSEIGFSNCTLVLSVLKIENLGFIYKEISKFEDASVVNTQFKVNNEEGLKLQQYKKALLSAKTKGELMATTLNAKLGVPLLIEEVIMPKVGDNDAPNNIYVDKTNNKNNYAKIKILANVHVEFQLE